MKTRGCETVRASEHRLEREMSSRAMCRPALMLSEAPKRPKVCRPCARFELARQIWKIFTIFSPDASLVIAVRDVSGKGCACGAYFVCRRTVAREPSSPALHDDPNRAPQACAAMNTILHERRLSSSASCATRRSASRSASSSIANSGPPYPIGRSEGVSALFSFPACHWDRSGHDV